MAFFINSSSSSSNSNTVNGMSDPAGLTWAPFNPNASLGAGEGKFPSRIS
jgi:hypothetical protein